MSVATVLSSSSVVNSLGVAQLRYFVLACPQPWFYIFHSSTTNFCQFRLQQFRFCTVTPAKYPRFLGSCVFCAPLDWHIGRHSDRQSTRHIGRHIGRVSTDMSVDVSVECRSICRSRCVTLYIGWHIGRASLDMSTDTRPIHWSICQLRVVVRLSANMSIYRLPTFRRYTSRLTYRPSVDQYVDRDVDQ